MRTTVTLPPSTHRRAREIAVLRGTSVSSVIAELAARGLATMDDPVTVTTDPRSGFPTISIGRSVSADEVATLLTDD